WLALSVYTEMNLTGNTILGGDMNQAKKSAYDLLAFLARRKQSQPGTGEHCDNSLSQYVNQRAHNDLRRRLLIGGTAFAASAFVGFNPLKQSWASSLLKSTTDRPIVLTNLKLFDGSGSAPQKGLKVLVVGNKIQDILEQ